jgi:hypothetical protein
MKPDTSYRHLVPRKSLCLQTWSGNSVESFQAQPPSSLLVNSPALEATEAIASCCTWTFWDPLAFWMLIGTLLCPECVNPLTTDSWAKLPRRITGLLGIELLLSKQYRCKGCKVSESSFFLTAIPACSLLSNLFCVLYIVTFCICNWAVPRPQLHMQGYPRSAPQLTC